MKIKIARDILLSSLQKVNSIISSRSTLPILGNVLLQAQNEKLTLTTTDLDIRIKTELNADVIEEGQTTLPARKFFEIIRELYGDEVYLENENNHMSIQCSNSNFRLLGLSAEDFPLPLESGTIRNFSLDQVELSKILNLISYAVNQDDTRKALNGILLSINENNFTSVATDGRRLALVEKNIDDLSGNDGDIIVPVKSANELNRLLGKSGNVRIKIGENLITFVLDDSTIMTTKLIDENYPNYKQVIPVSFSREIILPREEFAASLKRVSLVVSERNFYVKITFTKNKLELSATSTDVGESKDSIDIEYDGPDTVVSFNPTFLLDPLVKVDSDDIKMKMNDGYSPIALSNDDGFLYVIMPMRNR
ncbi:MAG TPA: DNA polymerase III subunit beta [Victivallales bacterium]|nr:DNA polymerase III subunit beta [Victivallales bacterium]